MGNVLTDPQIHCLDKSKYGKGNLGYQGILMFFNSHNCNEYCKFLGLVNPRQTCALPPKFQLFNSPKEPEDYYKKI